VKPFQCQAKLFECLGKTIQGQAKAI
jgi:hypothetical protein